MLPASPVWFHSLHLCLVRWKHCSRHVEHLFFQSEWQQQWRKEKWKGMKKKKKKESPLIKNWVAARCRSSGFSLQRAGTGKLPSAVSVGLIREPPGTWQKLLVGCDGRIRRPFPCTHFSPLFPLLWFPPQFPLCPICPSSQQKNRRTEPEFLQNSPYTDWSKSFGLYTTWNQASGPSWFGWSQGQDRK